MPESSWSLQIFEVTDPHSQQVITKSLQDTEAVVVEPRTCGPDHYLIIGSAQPVQASLILRTVLSIDTGAILLHRSEGSDPVALWATDDPAMA